MRKLFKVCAILLTFGAIAYFASPYIPPAVTTKNLTPTHSYGETLTVDATITNFTPRMKDIYLAPGEAADTVWLFVDTDAKPALQPLSEETAEGKFTISPFGHRSVTKKFVIESATNNAPQTVWGDEGDIKLAPGSHTYYIAWGRYVSDKQTVTVQ